MNSPGNNIFLIDFTYFTHKVYDDDIILFISMSDERQEEINQIKLIAVGDSGVGKTSILTRFTYEKFNDYSEPTLGAAFLTKKHHLPIGKSIEFHVSCFLMQIWDTAGQ